GQRKRSIPSTRTPSDPAPDAARSSTARSRAAFRSSGKPGALAGVVASAKLDAPGRSVGVGVMGTGEGTGVSVGGTSVRVGRGGTSSGESLHAARLSASTSKTQPAALPRHVPRNTDQPAMLSAPYGVGKMPSLTAAPRDAARPTL